MKIIIRLLTELFYLFTGALAIFVALECFWPGVVLAYININWVLILWLVDGIVLVMADKDIKPN